MENLGQWQSETSFVAESAALKVWTSPTGFYVECRSMDEGDARVQRELVEFRLQKPSPTVELAGEELLPNVSHYFIGRDTARWAVGARSYRRVRWSGLRGGVDMFLDARSATEEFMYGFELSPGVSESQLVMEVLGGQGLALNEGGSLVLATKYGRLTQSRPRSWQITSDGGLSELETRFRIVGERSFGLEVKGRDLTYPLLVDPGLEWSSYLGGNADDFPRRMKLDSGGRPCVVGWTWSTDFPTTPGVLSPLDLLDVDAFVSRLTEDASDVVFSTYLGGANADAAWGVELLSSGEIVVAGSTSSSNFALPEASWDTVLDGDSDAFVIQLSENGDQIQLGTLYGGSGEEGVVGVGVDDAGNVLVAGNTSSGNLPGTGGSAVPLFGGGPWDSFVVSLPPDFRSPSWASYLGGDQEDIARSAAVANSGEVLVGGRTTSTDFPVTRDSLDDAYESIAPGLTTHGFVTKFSRSGAQLEFSTFMDTIQGGVVVEGVDVNSSGLVGLVGGTGSSQFPTTPGAFDTNGAQFGGNDPFAAVLTSDGSALVFSTYLGDLGSPDLGVEVILEDSGALTALGYTAADDFPTTPGSQDSVLGVNNWDAFVTRIKPDGSDLLYSTLLGEAPGRDILWSGAMDTFGGVWVGLTDSVGSFPHTRTAFDDQWGGVGPNVYGDGVLAYLELQPIGVTSLGVPGESCFGDLRLTALGEPIAGNNEFAVACTGPPPASVGYLLLAGSGLAQGFPVFGVTLFLDPTFPIVPIAVHSHPVLSYAELLVPLPGTAAGLVFYVQEVWLNTASCGGALSLSGSDGLEIAVQSP